MWDELQNALAWYRAAPQRWIASAQQELSAAAQWIWEVIQGDFNEEQSTAQVVTGTVISMIPFVELCDVRDLVANCRKIHEDKSNKWAWLALVLTLIGLFPTLGSLAKGCLKIPFSYGRRAALRSAATAFDSDIWKATRDALKSKDEWRRRFAVWTSWNRNGEYVTYAVPLASRCADGKASPPRKE